MEVILLEPVNKLGNAGEIVVVKNGYARNFLIPKGKVLRATNQNKAEFEIRRAEIEKENKAKQELAEKEATKIDGKFVVVVRQAGEDGRLFGSVSARDVADAVKSDLGAEIKRNQIDLNKPIKALGVYPETVIIHGNVTAKIFVNVARSVEEAKDAEKEFLNPKVEAPQEEFAEEKEEKKKRKGKKADAEAEVQAEVASE